MANEQYAIIVVFMMFSPILSFFLMPIISAMSRHNEYAADRFGSDLSSKDDLVNALLKLANENKSFPLSHPIYIFFHYSHPPLVERFKALGFYGAGIAQLSDDIALQSDCGIELGKE
ncbi:MAG: M48 family metalloprotease [Arcobacteraceae bacterium]|nr:M48 family metalloprotease [Arcobacteraceae bacterium]